MPSGNVCGGCAGTSLKLKLSLIAEFSARGLRQTTKFTGLDRKTARAILNNKKVKASTLAKIVRGLRSQED